MNIIQMSEMIIWLRITTKSTLTSKKIKLMISRETMWCHKGWRIHRYQLPNKLLSLEKFAHHVLILFYPLIDEKEILSGFLPMSQNKLQEEGVQDLASINKKKFEPMVIYLIKLSCNLKRIWLIIKANIAKLKMMKHQG